MLVAITLTTLAASTVAVAVVEKRATPQHDFYIFEDEECQGKVGQVCEGLLDGQCCSMGTSTELGTSAMYTEPGGSEPISDYEIGVYARMPEDDGAWNMCGLRQSRDSTCADGRYLGVSGAKVSSGSDTETRRLGRRATQNSVAKYFYLSDKTRWTLAVDSAEGKELRSLPNSRKPEYLRQHGHRTILI